MPHVLKSIIFDVDGTLAETEEEHRWSFNAAFRAFGMSWQWDVETYRSLLSIGGGRERLKTFFTRVGAVVDQTVVADLHREKSRLYAARVAGSRLVTRPGVLRLIAEAHAAGVRLACATPSQQTAVVALLRSLLGPQGESAFAVLGCGDDVLHKKPAPDIYLWVLKQLECEAESCIVIEDTPIGLAAATAAGLPTVVAVSIYGEPSSDTEEPFTGAMAVISNLGEPHRPFTLLAGRAYGHGFVNLDLLRLWLTQRYLP